MQKIKIISIFFLLFLFQNIYAQTEKIIIDKESEYYLQIDKDNCLKIIISDSSNKTSKIINFYKNNGDNSFLYIGSMESISLEMGEYGEGLQFIYKSNNFIRRVFARLHFLFTLFFYLLFNIKKNERIIVYHSLSNSLTASHISCIKHQFLFSCTITYILDLFSCNFSINSSKSS